MNHHEHHSGNDRKDVGSDRRGRRPHGRRGGGVGDLTLTYGYEKMNTPLMILTVIILVVIVQLIQLLGGAISAKLRAHQS